MDNDDKFVDFSKEREEDEINWKEVIFVDSSFSFWNKCQACLDAISQYLSVFLQLNEDEEDTFDFDDDIFEDD